MPGRGNKQDDEQSAEGMQLSPGLGRKQLMRDPKINDASRQWKQHSDQALQQKTESEIRGQYESPKSRMRFLFVQGAKKGPQAQRDRESQHDVRDQNPGE